MHCERECDHLRHSLKECASKRFWILFQGAFDASNALHFIVWPNEIVHFLEISNGRDDPTIRKSQKRVKIKMSNRIDGTKRKMKTENNINICETVKNEMLTKLSITALPVPSTCGRTR